MESSEPPSLVFTRLAEFFFKCIIIFFLNFVIWLLLILILFLRLLLTLILIIVIPSVICGVIRPRRQLPENRSTRP